jgi:uncharacterized membrane protein YhaH (DUF805 family)
MKGDVIGFHSDSNTGAISGHDGKRYDFVPADWHGQSRPRHGDLVDFIPEGERAVQIYPVEPEYVSPSFARFYFSPNGRISRSQYWLWYIVPVLVISIVLSAIAGIAAAAGIPGLAAGFESLYWLFALLTFWPGIAVLVKRIHDRNRSGWLVVLPIAAGLLIVAGAVIANATGAFVAGGILSAIGAIAFLAIAIWFFVEFGCMPGTDGPNRYGPDPVV